MTEQPTTAAGRHFLDVVLPRYGGLRQSAGKWTRSEFTDAILAIEAEAAAQPTLPDMPHYTHRDQNGNYIEDYHVCGCRPVQAHQNRLRQAEKDQL